MPSPQESGERRSEVGGSRQHVESSLNCQTHLTSISFILVSVLFTIHQPSSEIFNSFDHLILLNKGRVMYQGSVSGVPDYFADKGM